jgi:hypothetical protein
LKTPQPVLPYIVQVLAPAPGSDRPNFQYLIGILERALLSILLPFAIGK